MAAQLGSSLRSSSTRAPGLPIDPSNSANIYVLDGAGVQRSADGGVTFTTVAPAPRPGATPGIRVQSIAVDSTGALYLSAPAQNQIFVSADGGATLKPLPQLLHVLGLMAVGGKVFAGLTTPSVPFVVKLDPSASKILYSTFLGGTFSDGLNGIAVDAQGEAVLTGYTFSPDFPVTATVANPASPGKNDGFVAKLRADGTHLFFSTLLGASKSVSSSGVAVDSSGAVYVTGQTSAPDFPITPGVVQPALPSAACPRSQSNFSVTPNTGTYAFVTKLPPDGSAPAYSTFLTQVWKHRSGSGRRSGGRGDYRRLHHLTRLPNLFQYVPAGISRTNKSAHSSQPLRCRVHYKGESRRRQSDRKQLIWAAVI